MKKNKTAIQPTREENYSKWYQEVIKQADLAEHSPVRGCMTIKPLGMGIWENIQKHLNQKIKEKNVKNVYFPILIPLHFLQQEADHIKGFAKECAVLTHKKIAMNSNNQLIPSDPLEEPMIIRPTSETIIGEAFSRWINSYRDLPFLINQWANVMRWELRPRLFLRTQEFLWQEGHTVHENKEEAKNFALSILFMYKKFLEEFLALPVLPGEHTESEKFPGADTTYTVEAFMQDNKALQAGTSHFLGQNFSKAQNIKFKTKKETEEFGWTTSWGVSTRLIGGLIMAHSDDNGLVLPPYISPTQVIIIPIQQGKENEAKKNSRVLEYAKQLRKGLMKKNFFSGSLNVEIDLREKGGGQKYWEAIKKGYPIIIEIGSREVKKNEVCMTKRNSKNQKRITISQNQFYKEVIEILDEMQKEIFNQSQKRLKEGIFKIKNKHDFLDFFSESNKKKGLVLAPLDDGKENQMLLKDLKISFKGYPLDEETTLKRCLFTNKKVSKRVLVGASY